MADMPRDLKSQIDKLEEYFVVPTEKLKEITATFESELRKGLSNEGGTIVSCLMLLVLTNKLTIKANDSNVVYGIS